MTQYEYTWGQCGWFENPDEMIKEYEKDGWKKIGFANNHPVYTAHFVQFRRQKP